MISWMGYIYVIRYGGKAELVTDPFFKYLNKYDRRAEIRRGGGEIEDLF
jgi:hypothetical protein